MTVYYPPAAAPTLRHDDDREVVPLSIFLAGSIEMGQCEDWQQQVIDAIDLPEIDIYNPRRRDWDSSWKQDITDDNFRNQVEWELDHLDSADIQAFYFDPATMAPITLMELGICAANQTSEVVVACPPGYWRRGNVQIVCAVYGITLLDSLDALIAHLQGIIKDAA